MPATPGSPSSPRTTRSPSPTRAQNKRRPGAVWKPWRSTRKRLPCYPETSRHAASSTPSPRRRQAPPLRPDVDAHGRIAIMAPLANPPYPFGGGHRMRNFRIRHVLSALAIPVLFVGVMLSVAHPVSAQSKGTIKIASQSPLSGGQASLGEGIKLGAQLAVEKMKGNLEKMGYKVEFVPFDDQAKPDVGVANAKNIIADKDIMAVIGHLNSGVAIPSSEVYKEVNVVMISPANTNRVCGRDDVQGVVGSEFAHGQKIKSAYIVHDKTQYGQSIAEFFKADSE